MLRLEPLASIREGPTYGTGEVIQYRVSGLPSSQKAFVAIIDGRWRVARICKNGYGIWFGEHHSPEAALGALESEVATWTPLQTDDHDASRCWIIARLEKQATEIGIIVGPVCRFVDPTGGDVLAFKAGGARQMLAVSNVTLDDLSTDAQEQKQMEERVRAILIAAASVQDGR